MAATLKDIARLTGLSVPSVCLILNGQGHKFRAESCRSVQEAARALKYRPDSVMRRMGRASARHDAIGVVVRSDAQGPSNEHHTQDYIAGVNDHLLQRDQLMVMLKLAQLVDAPDQKPPRLLAERFIDGLLVVETGLPEQVERLVEHYEIMTVWLNTRRQAAADCVYPDEEHAGFIAADHLLKLGHRRLVFVPATHRVSVGAVTARYSSERRAAGFNAALHLAGLRGEAVPPADAAPPQLAALAARITASIRSGEGPTGIVAGSFLSAVMLLEALRHTGVEAPRDVSLVAAGDLPMFHDAWPDLGHVALNRAEIGACAAAMILEKIAHDGAPQRSRVFRGELVIGKTAAAAR